MKILLFEDNPENMNVAQQAMSTHQEHEFTFSTKAGAALESLAGSDGLITDFFAPVEDGRIEEVYQDLYFNSLLDALDGIVSFSTPKSEQGKELKGFINNLLYVGGFFSNDIHRLYDQIETFFASSRGRPPEKDYLQTNRGYGGVLMMQAYEQGKPCVLFSDLHRHALETSMGNPINGMVMLAPLMEKGIFTPEQLNAHTTDQGSYLISSAGYCKKGKDSPEQWELAYQKLMSQF